ncbi:hypothetical protein Tco_0413519 [Tanacetum coccineum]
MEKKLPYLRVRCQKNNKCNNQDKSKRSCHEYLLTLHSHLHASFKQRLKGIRTEDGFKKTTHYDTFLSSLEDFHRHEFINVDQLEKALDNKEFQRWNPWLLFKTTEEKVDSSKALDASLVIIESNGTESQEQDTSSRSGNDAHVDDADIRPIYNEEPMAEVQTTAEINIFATGQQHTEQPEFNNEG